MIRYPTIFICGQHATDTEKTMTDWLLTNALLVNEGRRFHGDLRIRGGRIEAIGSGLAARPGERVLDARGRWLLPGMIDAHVHFREPGLTDKADIASETRACLAGGVTSFMEMPNTRPPTTTRAALEEKCARAAASSRVNYAFYLGATNDNLDEIRALAPGQVAGVKLFMGASTGNMLVEKQALLEAIFRDVAVPLVTHCEDTPTILANEAAARERWGEDIPAHEHPAIRSRAACIASTRLAVSLAEQFGTRLHVAHVSTEEECALFDMGPPAGKRITAETCVHFLHFSDEDYARLGFFIKCNPAIKTAKDRTALTLALSRGRIDLLATDHAPHLVSEKSARYAQSPSGLPLVQFALQSALEHVHAGRLSLERVVEATSHAPAECFGVAERGYLREGFHADLVLVDPQAEQRVAAGDVLSKCRWTPFEGTTFHSSIAATFVNGELGWHEGELQDGVRGERLRFAR